MHCNDFVALILAKLVFISICISTLGFSQHYFLGMLSISSDRQCPNPSHSFLHTPKAQYPYLLARNGFSASPQLLTAFFRWRQMVWWREVHSSYHKSLVIWDAFHPSQSWLTAVIVGICSKKLRWATAVVFGGVAYLERSLEIVRMVSPSGGRDLMWWLTISAERYGCAEQGESLMVMWSRASFVYHVCGSEPVLQITWYSQAQI